MKHGRFTACALTLLGTLAAFTGACSGTGEPPPARGEHLPAKQAGPRLDSLADLSLAALRARSYGSTIRPELRLGGTAAWRDYHARFSADGSPPYDSLLASYESDGNRVYLRLDLPAGPAPADGYPVLIFVHGWVGREAAPGFDFMYTPDSLYSRYIDAFVDAGFVVLSPALRGHGTVNGIAAEGIEFLDAWDNASYLSPLFYAIDVLNLLEGMQSLETLDWAEWGQSAQVSIDTGRISIAGHSQGGDAVLTALAVVGEGSAVANKLAAGSIWSGCFGPRLEQATIYEPMAKTLEAFMAGDGDWNGTATGRDGRVNPNFVFGWPADWIGTVSPASPDWTWQAETWSVPTVSEVLQTRHEEMYRVINERVDDIDDASFEHVTAADGKVSIAHDPRIVAAMQAIDAYGHPEYLSEPLHLHHSDQDYYSIPRWNTDLAARVNQSGGRASNYVYPRNTHSLLVSEHAWFSPGEVVAGLPYMIRRDLALFSGAAPAGAARQADEPLSIEAIRRYASSLRNAFEPEFESEPYEGMPRRVVSFRADGLKQYALVIEPAGDAPEAGWPVLLALHGHHPNPPEYARVADGHTDRPGDYYRGIPPAYARRGFLVVVPDFRGHNDSEGGGYAGGLLESYWYTRDAIAAFRALQSLPDADTSNVFLWGHSMGGDVTLRTLLALGGEVRGASIWSSSSAGLLDKAGNYARRGADDDRPAADLLASLAAEIDALPFDFDPARADAVAFLQDLSTPLNIHHATGDPVTPFAWSKAVAEALAQRGHRVTLYAYPTEDHLLTGVDFEQAADRDAALFKDLMH